jgi:hypothetical protein
MLRQMSAPVQMAKTAAGIAAHFKRQAAVSAAPMIVQKPKEDAPRSKSATRVLTRKVTSMTPPVTPAKSARP